MSGDEPDKDKAGKQPPEGSEGAGQGQPGEKGSGRSTRACDQIVKRRSRWQSSLAALRYVNSVSQDNEVGLRDSDRATSIWLVIVCFFALLSLVLPQFASPFQPHALYSFLQWTASQRLPLILAADVLFGFALLLYVANRFGIITTLTPRQALLSWQLMVGSSLLGIFTCVNLGLLSWVVVQHTHIYIPEAHPGQAPPAATTGRTP